ncbi:TPA: putative phage abortive infection protein [Aeromonas hydrophila]|uniref:putative phage abortive infection protein n=1 Tax=Aeromonas hydrophila TaxID=644 RepID=UPI0028D9FCB5|nr:putative phage abortive infection protein [Aeromonas hydrophila]
MKHCSVIIVIIGLLYVGAVIGITISSQNINTIALIIFTIYIAYVFYIKFKGVFHNKITFLETIRSNTLYSSFKKSLLDENDASQSNDALLKILHMMLVVGIIFMAFCFIINLIGDGEKLGPFGDFLGGVLNPIFTLMTFFGVIVTIALQKIELKAAREEYTKSANALGTQAIENTFFNMLSLHHKIVEKINFNATGFSYTLDFLDHPNSDNTPSLIGEKACQGAEAFSRLLSVIECGIQKEKTFSLYKIVQNHHNHHFGSYFRSLYQIMKFIVNNNSIGDDDKKKYMSILRAQLSSDELIALFINCSGDMVDDGQFRAFLVKYHMLEHMPLSYHEDDNEKYYMSKNFIIADIETIKEYLSNENNGALGKRDFYLPSVG